MPYLSSQLGREASVALIEGLHAESTLARSGARVIRTTARDVRIPRAAAAVPTWVPENTPIPLDSANPSELKLTPQSVKVLVSASTEAIGDSEADIINGVQRDLTEALAAAADKGMLIGAGHDDDEPRGLLTVAGGISTDATLSPATWEGLARAASALRGNSARPDVAFISVEDLLALQLEADQNGRPLVGDPESGAPGVVAGLKLFASPAIPESTALVAEARQLAVVIRDDGRIDVDDSAFFGSDAWAVRGVARVEAGAVNPAGALIVGSDHIDADPDEG